MHKDKWIFYTDLFGGQRWERIDAAGLAMAESQEGFPTLVESIADASLHGYRPGDEYAHCALEWRCAPLVPLSGDDGVAADLVLIQ